MRRSSSGQDEEEEEDMLERPDDEDENSLVMDPNQRSLECLNDDDDDDSKPQDSFLEDSYGSPAGLRQSFNMIMEDDEDTKEDQSSTPDFQNRSRNKRKNFKPRNILSETAQVALNFKKNLLMPQKRDNSPMDLSVQGANGVHEDDLEEEDEDDRASSEAEKVGPMTSAGLSVVRPEVLFGQAAGDLKFMGMGQQPPVPPLAALAPFLAASNNAHSGAPSMKDAFQEVLKLFGFPPELAEVFAKNAQALQQQESNDTNSTDEGMD